MRTTCLNNAYRISAKLMICNIRCKNPLDPGWITKRSIASSITVKHNWLAAVIMPGFDRCPKLSRKAAGIIPLPSSVSPPDGFLQTNPPDSVQIAITTSSGNTVEYSQCQGIK